MAIYDLVLKYQVIRMHKNDWHAHYSGQVPYNVKKMHPE